MIEDCKVGDILKVYQGGTYHFEKVIELTPEILTEDMPETEDAEISIQGVADNLKYEIVPTFKIAAVLLRKEIKLTDEHCICTYDQYGGAINPKCLIHGNGR